MQFRQKQRKFDGSYDKKAPEVQGKLEGELKSVFGDRIYKLADGAWEFGLTYGVKADKAKEVFKELKENSRLSFNMLLDVTAVDFLDSREPRFDMVYQLLSLTHLHRLCIKIGVGEEKPEVDTVRDVWNSANFLEREVWDMYGITFRGHGDLRRILMYDEFVGHPLRKDYPIRGKQPRVKLRVPELRNTSQDMRKEQLVTLPTVKRTANQKDIYNVKDSPKAAGEAE